jgi:hypothetical protein
MSADSSQLNALVESGVRRDAVEVKKLEGSQPQSNRYGLGELLIRTLQQGLNARVERNLPTERAEDERCREVAILLGEVRCVRGVKKVVAVSLAVGDERENLECGDARRGYRF